MSDRGRSLWTQKCKLKKYFQILWMQKCKLKKYFQSIPNYPIGLQRKIENIKISIIDFWWSLINFIIYPSYSNSSQLFAKQIKKKRFSISMSIFGNKSSIYWQFMIRLKFLRHRSTGEVTKASIVHQIRRYACGCNYPQIFFYIAQNMDEKKSFGLDAVL